MRSSAAGGGAAPFAPAGGSKSASQLAASPASVRQKNTDVPSGAAIADTSASPGPRRRESTGASSASARSAERRGSALSTASATTPGASRGAGVQQHADVTLLPQRHRLRAVL